MFAAPGKPRAALRRAGVRAAADGSGRAAVPRRPAGARVHRPGGHLRLRGGGAALPARPDPAGHRRGGMGPGVPGRAAAGAGARGLPGGRLRPRARLRRRGDAVAAHLHLAALPPGGSRLRPAERCPRARGRHRPHPRRAGAVPGPGGQRPGAVRRELRDREPAGHDADVPRAVRRPERAPGGRLPVPAAGRAARRRAARDIGPVRGRADPGRAQRRLLRAHAARPADGRGAGGGTGPVLRPQPGLRAHHPGPAPGRRHLPPGRRRLPRPAAIPARLGDRLPRA